jgi:two-component system KDP operon response regulator KdpE
MASVLVVDADDRAGDILTAAGYDVTTIPDGTRALRAVAGDVPDLILIDIDLPDTDGIALISGLQRERGTPVVVLSGRSEPGSAVRAIEAGADDYLAKPFGAEELVARVRAVLRRTSGWAADPSVVWIGRFRVDLLDRRITDPLGQQVELTPTQWSVLEILLRHPGQVVGQQRLLREVWGDRYLTETGYLRQYLAQLRRKLEENPGHPRHLLTEPGVGYRFQA